MKSKENKKVPKRQSRTTKTEVNEKTVVKDEVTSNQEKALLVTFIILAVLVVLLFIVVIRQNKTVKITEDSHITIPVLQEETESSIKIDLTEFENNEDTEYVFIVSNYRGDKKIKKSLEYDLEIVNEYDIDLELYKNEGTTNLLQYERDEVEDNKLFKNRKQEDIYKLIIKGNNKAQDKAEIIIKVES